MVIDEQMTRTLLLCCWDLQQQQWWHLFFNSNYILNLLARQLDFSGCGTPSSEIQKIQNIYTKFGHFLTVMLIVSPELLKRILVPGLGNLDKRDKDSVPRIKPMDLRQNITAATCFELVWDWNVFLFLSVWYKWRNIVLVMLKSRHLNMWCYKFPLTKYILRVRHQNKEGIFCDFDA